MSVSDKVARSQPSNRMAGWLFDRYGQSIRAPTAFVVAQRRKCLIRVGGKTHVSLVGSTVKKSKRQVCDGISIDALFLSRVIGIKKADMQYDLFVNISVNKAGREDAEEFTFRQCFATTFFQIHLGCSLSSPLLNIIPHVGICTAASISVVPQKVVKSRSELTKRLSRFSLTVSADVRCPDASALLCSVAISQVSFLGSGVNSPSRTVTRPEVAHEGKIAFSAVFLRRRTVRLGVLLITFLLFDEYSIDSVTKTSNPCTWTLSRGPSLRKIGIMLPIGKLLPPTIIS